MRQYRDFYIDGQWVPALGEGKHELINPTTETPFATVSMGNVEDVDRAVRAARKAFSQFSVTSTAERIELFESIIATYATRIEDLTSAVVEEIGSPRSAKVQITGPIEQFKQAIVTLRDYDFQRQMGGTTIRREAIGVCGLITPWNWPVQTPSTKLSSALAAGCTVVLKPSEYSPVSSIILAEILHEAGVPPGVFNLVVGDGPTVGAAISKHPDIDAVSFTGSTRAGVSVAEAAAPTVKRVTQELGGKSANIVFQDADLRAAARWNIGRGMFNSGQSCHAPTRILVHESQIEEFLKYLVEELGQIRLGDPNNPATTMGPVVNRAQFERIQRYIQIGIDEGARLVAGGPGRPKEFNRGYFVRPTIFADVTPAMKIAQEEIFGPVLVVISYATEQEAVAIANGTPYGLGAYVFTSNMSRARAVGEQLRAGRVFLNGAAANTAAPMGGYKMSGNGREMGIFGLEEYLETKAMFGFEA